MIEQNTSLIDLKAVSEPVCKLIETVSSAIGIWYEPKRMINQAKSEVEVKKIKALGEIEIKDAIDKRLAERLYNKEIKRQNNIESITNQAIKFLPEKVSKDSVDEDWVTAFYENCQDISDEQMQILWAKILSGEVTRTKSFSLRTLQFIKTMTKDEANIFANFCNYIFQCEQLNSRFIHIPFDDEHNYLQSVNLGFAEYQHLESIGLIYMPSGISFSLDEHKILEISYGKSKFVISRNYRSRDGVLEINSLTPLGNELAKLSNFIPDETYIKLLKATLPQNNLQINEATDKAI